MKIDKIAAAIDKIKDAESHLSKFRIFDYDTLDEAAPRKERIRADITVEIGGPATHIKFTVLTREEHTKVKACVSYIINSRLKDANRELKLAMKEALCSKNALK